MLTRRQLLQTASSGFGYLAFAGLAADHACAADASPRQQQPHFDARAKRVLFLCMSGGPSHVDSFDYKPELQSRHGQPMFLPGSKTSFGKLMASPFQFSQHGDSGLWISDLFPSIARHADKLCVMRGMQTSVPAHPQAFLELHTGSSQFVRPSLGSWVVYGLGSENADLPGFISLSPPSGNGGSQNYGSAFLPAMYQGTQIDMRRGEGKFQNIRNDRMRSGQQRRQIDLLQSLNRDQFEQTGGDPQVEGIIESYELAFRMQSAVPEVMNLEVETAVTSAAYGLDNPETQIFGRQCLMVRRFLEAGVRFVEVSHHGWDQHSNLTEGHRMHATAVDQPIAALLADLDSRGLLDDTLILWGGEFGRTPVVQGLDGRDHNHLGYTMWMAGGGAKAGHVHGETDEFGREAISGKIDTHDLHATILHLLGFDHRRLTYRHAGRDFRLTDVHGNVVDAIVDQNATRGS